MSDLPRPVVFGEVLFDRFDDGSEVLGGAPFNVAWNLRGLGLDPLLVSRVGADAPGERILDAMRAFGLDRSGVQVDPDHPTGAVDVHIADGEPRFEILTDRAWDHIEPPTAPGRIDLVYHGSLALRSAGSADALDQLLRTARPAPVFFDVNLRPPWFDPDAIPDRMRGATAIKLNQDELDALAPGNGQGAGRAQGLLQRTGASMVVVTRGAKGALAVTAAGEQHELDPAKPAEFVDTVGAGDAFSSVLILGLLSGWPLATMLERAQTFAGAVVGLRGATSTDPDFYSRFRPLWSSA